MTEYVHVLFGVFSTTVCITADRLSITAQATFIMIFRLIGKSDELDATAGLQGGQL